MKQLIFLSLLISFTASCDDEREEHENKYTERRVVMTPVIQNPKFKAECSSCHMLYTPGLLPARSWTKMMNTLDKHFGENASLDDKTKKEILDYLVQNSSDSDKSSRRSQKINSSINSSETPLRISETAYFSRKHHELANQIFKRKKIGSKANCIACHSGAENGNFNEHEVKIPRE